MRGGKRDNAGRKPAAESDKRQAHKVYLTSDEYDAVLGYKAGESFSRNCSQIINDVMRAHDSHSGSVRFIDLFAGLGGIRIGFENGFRANGFDTECVFTSEIKAHAIDAYKGYFKGDPIHGDITKIPSSEIPDFDYLLAGFPCQPFSSAGKGLGFNDTRGTLFFEIERILRDRKPRGFLLENVEGLMKHDGGRTLEVILSKLVSLGYLVSHRLLDSKDFGLAQSRPRVYIVGTLTESVSLDGFDIRHSSFRDIMETGLPSVDSHFTRSLLASVPLEDLPGKCIRDKRGGDGNIHSWDIGLKGRTTSEQRELLNTILRVRRQKKWAEQIGIPWMDGMPLTLEQISTFYDRDGLREMLDDLVEKGYLVFEHPKGIVDGVRRYDESKPKGYNIVAGKLSFEFSKIIDANGLAPTLVATDVSRLGVVDGNGIRKLTIREAQRLCGYPEEYDLSFLREGDAFDLLGNTVCVPVIEQIAFRMARIHSDPDMKIADSNTSALESSIAQ